MNMHQVSIITGIMHCGSTLLLDMLKASPGVFAEFEVGLLEADDLSQDGLAKWCEADARFRMLHNRFAITKDDIIALHTSRNWPEAYKRLHQRLMRDEAPEVRTSRMHFIDKTPSYAQIIGRTMERLPMACVIGLVRDPRAVYCSWLKRPKRRITPAAFGLIYNRSMKSLMKESMHNCRLMLVRFEHLVMNPFLTLPPLCAHLGIPYTDSMCNPMNAFNQHDKTKNQFRPIGEDRPPREVAAGIDYGSVLEYRKLLEPGVEQAVLEQISPDLWWTFYDGPGPIMN